MSSILNNNWYNLNSTRKYPLDDGCTGIDDVGKLFPATLITDLHLRLNKSVGVGAMISSIVVSNTLVSVTFLAINHPILPSLYDPAPPTQFCANLAHANQVLGAPPLAPHPLN